jgi:hypothetical protein
MSKPPARKARSATSSRSTRSTTPRRRGSAAGQAPRPSNPSSDAIAQRAYELFVRRGAVHGHDWDDWLTAERELWVEG